MRTPCAIELLAATVLASGALAACDGPVGPRFPGKGYGQSDGGDGGAGDDAGALPPPGDRSDDALSGGGDGGEAGADDGQGDVVSDDAGEGDDVVDLPPDMLIKHNVYRARFDRNSVRGIRDNAGYRNLGAVVANRIRDNLVTTPEDGLTTAQTFGDGTARSTTLQELRNSAGDASRGANEASASGVRALDRVVGGDCPGPFICGDRLVVTPVKGDATTVCFHTAATGKRAVIPYGAAPNYKAADFAAAYGSYGPYIVTKYAGDAVDCDEPGANPLVTETVTVTVAEGSAAGVTLPLRTVDPITPDYAVTFVMQRVSRDLNAPYIDETVFLNARSVYYINEDVAELVKTVITTRMSVDIAAQAGGGILGGLAGLLANIDGISVELHLDWCRNLLDAEDVDHCPGP